MNTKTSHSALARSNPVFMTAKTAICLMAKAGMDYAAEILHALGLNVNKPLQSMNDPDVILGNAVVVEAKYNTMCRLIEKSGYHICVDLPCGYTPKALQLSEKGIRFIGLDLPIVAQEIKPIMLALAKHPEKISFCEVDATNFDSLRLALKDVDEPMCITTEGMLMYFDENEINAVVSNICAILKIHGGVWITPDPEVTLQFFETFRSVFGENSLDKLAATRKAAERQSEVCSLDNPLIISSMDITSSTEKAEAFIKKHGLKIDKVNLAEEMPTLNIYQQLTNEQIKNFKIAMGHCHYWVITLDNEEPNYDNADKSATPSELTYSIEDNIFKARISGRLDSLNAPKLLTAWEDDKGVIDRAEIECEKLEYITSAGIRVLLMLQENLPLGVTLTKVNPSMAKILTQKGLSKLLLI